MAENIVFSSEDIDVLINLTFKPGSTVTTAIGSTVRFDAINVKSGEKVAGTAVVLSATQLRGKARLEEGVWSVQALMTPPGESSDVVFQDVYVVKAGAAP